MNITLQEEKHPTYCKVLDKEGCEKYKEELQRKQVSELINKGDIHETYPVWNKKTLLHCVMYKYGFIVFELFWF